MGWRDLASLWVGVALLASCTPNAEPEMTPASPRPSSSTSSSDVEISRQLLEVKRRLRSLRDEISGARPKLRNLNVMDSAFLPPRLELYQAHVLDPKHDRLLLLEWVDDRSMQRTGLQIWRPTLDDRSVVGWDLIFRIDPHPVQGRVSIGAPGAMTDEVSDASAAFFTGFGDVTGDGHSDVAIQLWNSGSGGCGVVRVMQNTTGVMREIFRRMDCDHRAQIHGSGLIYTSAIYPKGCRSAHGCGRKTTWLEWNGSRWDVLKVRRKVF